MVRTQIQLTEEQAKALKRVAAERGCSFAAVIRQAVEREVTTEEVVRRRRRALEAIRAHPGSGRSDVSERHDDYLAQDYLD